MAKPIILAVQAPYGGISRRQSYQTQPPFTSYDSVNFWPVDVKTGRITSAVRPGLELFGSLETPCNMISTVSGIRAAHPAKSFVAAYEGQIYYWNGTTMVSATGAQAAAVNTGVRVSAAPVVNQLIICDDTLAPIAFDYTNGQAATIVASAGTVPVAATIAVGWQGALWLVIDSVLYASRVGDITDWDYSVALTDLYGAFYTDGDYKGVLAGPITAVMPQASDVMMVSTVSGTLAMRGHPRQGGVFEPVGTSYALGQGAWCVVPDGTLLMLTPIGLMSLAAQPGAVMAPVSRDKIPDELIGLSYDRDDPLVNMQYDTRWNGVHIYVRGGEEQAWWFDMNTGGFHRQEVASYPYAVTEFADFITEDTSGVMLARYNGIYLYDRFANEVINSSIVAGPVKISANTMVAGKIQSARVTFARDTPTGTGSLKVCAGLDGQDAVNRLLQGQHQYETDLTSLEANNGMCYPAVTGHAAVFALDSDNGDLAIEEITANITQMGHLTSERTDQIAITGEASEFSGAYLDLDNSVWAGYSEAEPQSNPDEQLTEYTHFIDLSLLPVSWWDEVKGPNGEDIRVADGDDNQVPSSLVDFSLSGSTGMLVFKMTQPTTANKVRIWVGNEDAVIPPVTDTYGQYNCYDDYWRGFWPDGGGNSNQTQYGDNTFTSDELDDAAGAFEPYWGLEDGPMGAKATDFNPTGGGGGTYWQIADWVADHGLGAQVEWTVLAAIKNHAGSPGTLDGMNVLYKGLTQYASIRAQLDTGNFKGSYAYSNTIAYGATTAADGTALDTWHMAAGRRTSDTARSAWVDGTLKDLDTVDSGSFVPVHFMMGNRIGSLYAGDGFTNAVAAMQQIHTTNRSDAWVEWQGEMMDQPTFWGTIGEFTLVNQDVPDVLLPSACPVGPVPQTEVGTTDGYALLTPEDPSDGSVTKFSHLIDLAQLPAGWWTQAAASGMNGLDIRATNTANTILPFDLIEFDDVASTGLGVIRMAQAEGSPASIRLWVGNAAAITVDPCNAYGQYTAYDANWRGFWPTGSGTDRTQYQNDMTATGDPAVTGTSPVDSLATVYNNELGTNQYATASNLVPDANPITLMGCYKKPSGAVNDDSVLASVQDSDQRTAVMLATRPSEAPARLTNRNVYGTEYSAVNSTSVTATNENFQAGTSYGNHTRISYVGEAAGSSTSSQDVVIVDNMDRIMIAAEYADTPIRGMNATISLVGLHQAARGDAWVSYWAKSLDQTTFWTVGAWTADPTALS